MSIGSVLVGVAIALIVGAYLARPFRVVNVNVDENANLDRDIEAWMAQARSRGTGISSAEADSEPVNFCFECGRRVSPDDRFCAGCGTRLKSGG